MGELNWEVKQTPNLTQAIINVMNEVDGIEKAMTVGAPGSGSSYKGVSDRDVKIKIGRAMAKHGLVLIPIGVTPKTTIDRYPEIYQGRETGKMKQQVNTEVVTKYKLSHTSGEFDILEGFGMGVDSQDKAAGKATTYALKYTLLYLFLVPTGDIDDSDRTHSDEIEVPAPKTVKLNPAQPIQPEPNAEVATGTTTPTPVAAPEAKPAAKTATKAPAKTEAKTGTPAAALTPNKDFEQPEKPSDAERRATAKEAFKPFNDAEVLKYLVQDLKITKYSTVETFLNASSLEEIGKVYNGFKAKNAK